MGAMRATFVIGMALVLSACGAGSAGKVVRPDDKTASDALGESSEPGVDAATCSKVAPKSEPLIVDWPTNDQLNLRLAMKAGIGIVAYDCKTMRLLKDCRAKGGYAFAGIGEVMQEAVQIDDRDAARATLPLAGAKLGGEIARGSSIDIALAYIGKRGTPRIDVTREELEGQCDGATHFVRTATVGAFVMKTGTRGQVRAAAEIFGAGASGESSSEKHKLNAAGELGACKRYKEGDPEPPAQCGASLRLELWPFATAKAESEPKEPEGRSPAAARRASWRAAASA